MRSIISRLKNTPKTPMEKSETYLRVYGLNISRKENWFFFFIYSPKNCFVKKKYILFLNSIPVITENRLKKF